MELGFRIFDASVSGRETARWILILIVPQTTTVALVRGRCSPNMVGFELGGMDLFATVGQVPCELTMRFLSANTTNKLLCSCKGAASWVSCLILASLNIQFDRWLVARKQSINGSARATILSADQRYGRSCSISAARLSDRC